MDIIVTGSIAYDYLMRFPGRFTEHLIREKLDQVSLSFLVDDMSKHWGGNAANIAYSLALLGLRPKVMGTVGRDFGDYRLWLERVGVDCTTVRQIDDVFTASFFANIDLDNNQIGSFYSGAMAYARNYGIADVYDGIPEMVVISPNDPQAMMNLAEECRRRKIRFVADPSQQVARLDGDQLRQLIEGAYALVVNAYESEVIANKTGLSLGDLRSQIEVVVVTRGSKGSEIFHDGEVIDVPVFAPEAIKDPTGVGDAYRSGLLTGLAHGWNLKLAGEIGALCATYVLEQV
ncbi:MAG: carbohydrate kinase family protein, partial [Anaerolineae bacterium]|nr:carbohydrate kinase family protein [Anaerolineae bacterium]